MKRFHVHVNVRDLDASIRFYSNLFAVEPAIVKTDYAKWMLEDPRVNFAISARGRMSGVDHLGIQVESRGELTEVADRLRTAQQRLFDEGATICCYASSEKAWVRDPSGISWETFHTTGESTTYGEASSAGQENSVAACCTPAASGAATSCG